MRVCFVGSAASYHVSKWLRHYAAQGDDVHLISTSDGCIPGVTVHRVTNLNWTVVGRHAFYLRYYLTVIYLLAQLRPDVVHALQINAYSAMAAFATTVPFIVTPFGGDLLRRPAQSRLARIFVWLTLFRADLVVCDGQNVEFALNGFRVRRAKVAVVRFGVDSTQFVRGPRDYGLCTQLQIAAHPVVISLRHLMEVYDVATLLRAAFLVLKHLPDVKFLIISDGPERQRLQALATNLEIDHSVIFVGWVQASDLPKYLSVADVYVSTSLSDSGLASSTGEAMACGVAPIISDFGENGAWISEGFNGFLFPAGDHCALADRLLTLLQDKALRAEFGVRSRKIIEERYDIRKAVAELRVLHNGVLSDLGSLSLR